MVILKIDDHKIAAEDGMKLIEVIDDMYFQLTNRPEYSRNLVPRLCYHESLESSGGSCRLCLVEVEKIGYENFTWSKLETSCSYELKEGEEIAVYTNSPRVQKARKMNMELLLAKSPDSEVLKHIAFKMGVNKNKRFEKRGDNYLRDCIDCGICTKACEEIVGISAITMAGRGTNKHVSTPYAEVSEDCIGCGICAYMCPTGAIQLEDKDGKRRIWGKEFNLVREDKYILTEEQLEFIKSLKKGKKSNIKISIKEDVCKSCERCVSECPQLLFTIGQKFNKNGHRNALWNNTSLNGQVANLACSGCKVCSDVCPESAIDIHVTSKKKVRILEDE